MISPSENIMPEFLADAELVARLDLLARRISYHNAAEGSQYTRELPLLQAARKDFYAALKVAAERGLMFESEGKGYLL
jgi:hypothetical protein